MSPFTAREYSPRDIPALTALWQSAFGDSAELIADFFRLLPKMGTAAVAELEGEAVGAAYAIDALEVCVPGQANQKCAYIYAVAADERFRGMGIGGSVYKAACELAKARGASLVTVFPIPELYGWYERLNGAKCVLHRSVQTLPSYPADTWQEISSNEYYTLREKQPASLPHLRLSPDALEFERLLCKDGGGGLFSCGDALAAAYVQDGDCIVQELLCPEAKRVSLASSLGGQLAAERVRLYSPGGEVPYISALSPLPPELIWNISFD